MNWRTASFVLLLMLASAAVWTLLSQEQERSESALMRQAQASADGADYYMENVDSWHFDEGGALTHTLKSPRVDYRLQEQQSNISAPLLYFMQAPDAIWSIRADHASSEANLSNFDLTGNVDIMRGDESHASLHLKTQQLHVDSAQALANTDAPVSILLPRGSFTANGLQANFRTQQLQLLHDVKGQYAQ